MTTGKRICVRCDKPITGVAVVVPQLFATSGARPNDFRHDDGDPDCTTRRTSSSRPSGALVVPPEQ